MTDENPYQDPAFKPDLNKQHRLIAKQLLKIHEQGPNFWIFLRMNAPWLLLRYIASIPIIWIVGRFGERNSLALAIGLLAAFFYFDLIYVRIQRKSWPVYEETLDWAKVRKAAEGE